MQNNKTKKQRNMVCLKNKTFNLDKPNHIKIFNPVKSNDIKLYKQINNVEEKQTRYLTHSNTSDKIILCEECQKPCSLIENQTCKTCQKRYVLYKTVVEELNKIDHQKLLENIDKLYNRTDNYSNDD